MHTIVQHHGVFPSAESSLSHKRVQGKIVAYNCSLCLLSVLFRSRLCLSQTLHSLTCSITPSEKVRASNDAAQDLLGTMSAPWSWHEKFSMCPLVMAVMHSRTKHEFS